MNFTLFFFVLGELNKALVSERSEGGVGRSRREVVE